MLSFATGKKVSNHQAHDSTACRYISIALIYIVAIHIDLITYLLIYVS